MTESKEMTTQSTARELAIQDGSVNPYEAAANDMGGTDGAFLRFNGKEGEYTYGQEDEVLLDDEEFQDGKTVELAVNMDEARRGWMCWIDSEVEKEVTERVVTGKVVLEENLPDLTDKYKDDDEDGWVECAEVPFRDISDGEEYLFKTSSKGGLKAFKKLLKDYGKQYSRHDLEDESAIVILGISSYEHKIKKHGTIYNPMFKLDRWVDNDTLLAAFSDDEGGYEAEDDTPDEAPVEEEKPKKAKAKKAKAAKKEEEPAEEKKPKRRARKF